MSDEKLIPPSRALGAGRAPNPLTVQPDAAPALYEDDPRYPSYEAEEATLDLRRYALALLRYKWLLVVALVLGAGGAAVAWRSVELIYQADGNLWIEVENRQSIGDVAPIRTSGLLQANAWIELLRSFAVLDSVVIAQRLYLQAPREHDAAFGSFRIGAGLRPGRYVLSVSPDGRSYQLGDPAGTVLESGTIGGLVGESLGFVWSPPTGALPAGASIPFMVLMPREAAQQLSGQLSTAMDRTGNFLRVSLSGTDPERVATVLNHVMDRHVELAAEVKRAKLDEIQAILEEQLRYTEAELADAERQLEEFRVETIGLPSDRGQTVTGMQITLDPVFSSFFEMRIRLEQIRRDRSRLEAALSSFAATGEVRIEALEVIQSAATSSELRRILDELIDARSQLRVYLDRYEPTYAPVQELLGQIETIESNAVPRVVEGILEELAAQERDLESQLDAVSSDLAAIPPRTIEVSRRERRVLIASNLYNELRSRVETARLAAASSIPDVRILDRPQAPRQPAGDRRMLLAGVILFGCLGAAMGGAILLDRMDARFRYAGDVGREMGLDILGSIPRIQNGRGNRGVLNAAQTLEAFRELRIHVGFAYGSAGPITLAVSSPAAGEGKSLIASNLAVAFAEVGRRTLLIDGDTRRGDAHKLLGRQQSPGLIDYLKERSGQEIVQKTDHANLDFIACGSRGVTTPELLASQRMTYFMGTLKRSYEVIIVDTPPLAAGGDALILSTLTGNLAVVIRTGTTEKQLAQVKLDQLSRLPIRVLGAILNDVDPSDGYHYYYSSYLPGYEPVPEEGEDQEVPLISDVPSQAS